MMPTYLDFVSASRDDSSCSASGNLLSLPPGVLLVALLLLALAPAADATTQPSPLPPAGAVEGTVVDAETGEPVGWANVAIVQLDRGEISHRDGEFHFYNVPPGIYTLRVSHVSYQTVLQTITIPDLDTVGLVIRLVPAMLSGSQVVITADRDQAVVPFRPTEELSGRELQQQLGTTLATTLQQTPGIAQRSMGAAPARPVVRGLGGERLQILEDGMQTGDLSGSSADHAVSLDPLTAERIEIIQGPAALLFESNALGGVINVVRNRIATSLPDRITGTLSAQGESVNSGYGGGLTMQMPAGPIALQLDGIGRRTSDLATPAGTLNNTDLYTWNGSLGASLVQPWGHVGAAAGAYSSEYGIPGGFVGAHEEGVRIEMKRSFAEVEAWVVPEGSLLRRLEFRAARSRYYHRELEANGLLGTEYGLLGYDLALQVHHGLLGRIDHGTIGVEAELRDIAANGASIDPTRELGGALFIYEEFPVGPLWMNASLRFDARRIEPRRSDGEQSDDSLARLFTGFSGGLALRWIPADDLTIGLSGMRSFRTPSVQELYSRGPHLAAYSYEIGNPALEAETGFGLEGSLRYAPEGASISLTLFRNQFDGYIHPRNTGDTNFRTLLPIYQQSADRALMIGGELAAEWMVVEGVVITGSLSHVAGDLLDQEIPLPMMPPMTGRFGLRYRTGSLTLGGGVRAAARQERTSAFESPTDGYLVADLHAQYQLVWGSVLHALSLTAENILDTEYRNHLSRTRSIMPEPGRNMRLLYRLYF